MRQAIAATILSATCLMPVSARSQEVSPSTGAATARAPLTKELEQGYRLKGQKRDAEAIAAFSSVLKRDPSNHAALTELGYLHAGLKHYASAVKYLGAASAQEPDNMRVRMDLGYAEQGLKRYDAAAEQFSIVASRPGEFQERARQALETAKAPAAGADQADVRQRRLRERGYAALRRGDKAAARTAFEAAVANDPRDDAAIKQLGFINLDGGRLEAAAANFEAVRALAPGDYLVALQLGYTYDRLRKKEQAHEAFTAALSSTDEKIHGAAQAALQVSGGPAVAAPSSSL